MAKKTGYESRLAVFKSSNDGWKHLAASVIERAVMDADNPAYKKQAEVREWLVETAPYWAEYVGMNKDAVREAMCKRFKI